MVTLRVIDDFYPYPEHVRELALEHDFSKGVTMDGHLYPGTVQPRSQEFTHWFKMLLEQAIGQTVAIKGTAFVSSLEGQFTEQWIHADSICARWAAVIYLFDGHHEHGTALWRHRASNKPCQDQEFYDALGVDVTDNQAVEALVARIKSEGDDESSWQTAGFSEARFNRLIVYPAKHFHSRYPRHSFGNTPETGRLVQVCFFD